MTPDDVAADIKAIRTDMDKILHGNGRRGLWALSDAVFGAPGRDCDGLVRRMQTLEERSKEARYLQRGIAIGIALVAAEHVFGLDLSALLMGAFGR